MRQAFVVMELLVVVAILSVLYLAVVLTLDAEEALKQARDGVRLSNIDAINTALYLYQVDVTGGPLGQAFTAYVSIPDLTATSTAGTDCGGVGLPSLPAGWSYHCAASSTYRLTNGEGWVPVNFSRISSGTPFGQLPVDPANTIASGLYYTYTVGTSWELNALMESVRYRLDGIGDVVSDDGGDAHGIYEAGPEKNISPISDAGLVGYWKFNEGSGILTADSGGSGNTGTLVDGPTWARGKIGNAMSFDGENDYVAVAEVDTPSGLSYTAWISTTDSRDSAGHPGDAAMSVMGDGTQSVTVGFGVHGGRVRVCRYDDVYWSCSDSPGAVNSGTWRHIAATHATSGAMAIYADGILVSTSTKQYQASPVFDAIGRGFGGDFWNGLIDEARVYGRALSAAEIKAIYNTTK